MIKTLIVCNANLNRSPTVAKFWEKKFPNDWVIDCGIYYGYPHQLNEKLVEWSEVIVVMTLAQKMHIVNKYRFLNPKVYILGISDEYDTDDPKLIEMLEWWYNEKEYNGVPGYDKDIEE